MTTVSNRESSDGGESSCNYQRQVIVGKVAGEPSL